MTVKELADYLAKLAADGLGERIVIMSKDEEGNGYSPFSGDHGTGRYFPDSTYSGEFWSERDLETEDPEDIPANGELAVVLWPLN